MARGSVCRGWLSWRADCVRDSQTSPEADSRAIVRRYALDPVFGLASVCEPDAVAQLPLEDLVRFLWMLQTRCLDAPKANARPEQREGGLEI